MTNLQRRTSRLLLQLHPPSFRDRFEQEMLLDYEDLVQHHGALRLTVDLFQSLGRQWLSVLSAELWSGTILTPQALLSSQNALSFQESLTPFEVLRGFALSVLLFSTFWIAEDPAGTSRDILKLFSIITTPGKALTSPPMAHKDVEIRDVTIVDVEHGNLLSHRTVLIEDGIVTSVVQATSAHAKNGSAVVDGRGRFLIPGLWDMHTHITHTEVDFPLYIANGVLGIRSMGGVQDKVFAWQKQLKDGSLFGPLAFVSGPILDGPNGTVEPKSYGVTISNAEEGRAEVDTLKAKGADFVKVYSGLSRESYFAIADEAKKVELPYAGHLPDRITIEEASNAGQRSFEHAIQYGGPATPRQTEGDDFMAEAMKTGNYSLIPEGIARQGKRWLDSFSQKWADEQYRVLVGNRTYLCPTLAAQGWISFSDEFASKPDARRQFIDPKTLVYWQPSMNLITKYRTPAYIEWVKVRYAKLLEQIPRQQALGVQLLAGTDLTVPYIYPGFSVHDEVRLMASAGLTNLQALQTATTHPVTFFGLQKSLGSVEAGKRAEFVLLDGNPLSNLNNLDRIRSVITHGRVLRRPELDAMTEDAANAVRNRAKTQK